VFNLARINLHDCGTADIGMRHMSPMLAMHSSCCCCCGCLLLLLMVLLLLLLLQLTLGQQLLCMKMLMLLLLLLLLLLLMLLVLLLLLLLVGLVMGMLLLAKCMLLGSRQVLCLDYLAFDVLHQIRVTLIAGMVMRYRVHGGLIEPMDLLSQMIVYIERFGGICFGGKSKIQNHVSWGASKGIGTAYTRWLHYR